jgi:hypothetical protein
MTLAKKLLIAGLCLGTGLGLSGCGKKTPEADSFSGEYALQSFGKELGFNYEQSCGERVKISFKDGDKSYTFYDRDGNDQIDERGDFLRIEGPGYSATITPTGTKTKGNVPRNLVSENHQENLRNASTTLELMSAVATRAEERSNSQYNDVQPQKTIEEQRAFRNKLRDILTEPTKGEGIKQEPENFTHTGEVNGLTVTYTQEGNIRRISYTTPWEIECKIEDTNNDGIIPNHEGDLISMERKDFIASYTTDHKTRNFDRDFLGIYSITEKKPAKQKASEFFQEAVEQLTREYKESLK